MARPATGSVRLRDVASAAGVSITTVSRILNGRETGVPVRDATRDRILAVASELGYRPNLLARALRGSPSSLLGVIARDISDPFHVQVLRGINEAARSRNYRLFLGHVDYRPDVAAMYGSMFEQSHADGIIVMGDIQGGEKTLDDLAARLHNVVGVSDRIRRGPIPGCYVDNVSGARQALDHLWNLGHRSIVCVSDSRTLDGPLRAEVYEAYMRDHGAGDRVRVYFTTQPDPEPSYRLGRELFGRFDRPNRPTAVFAASDTIAIGLLQAAFQAGIAIPRQLSMVGFDDIDIAAFTVPGLTTVSQNGVEMGRIAADMLLDMIERGTPGAEVEDVVMAPHLVVRQSTAPTPST
ncbi:MAG: LacI family transcriptional regulator [Chloroflexota bacterium]|nr:LacI family transcriptional regulator [Chloroflexota bacterium]